MKKHGNIRNKGGRTDQKCRASHGQDKVSSDLLQTYIAQDPIRQKREICCLEAECRALAGVVRAYEV